MLGIISTAVEPVRIRLKRTARRDLMMDQAGWWLDVPPLPVPMLLWGKRSFQCPAHHLPREAIQDDCQINKLRLQANISDIGYPELVDPGQLHAAGEIQINLQLVFGIRGNYEGRAAPP